MITAHPSAPDGLVLRPAVYSPSDFPRDSIILCRNTAPLVGFAYSLLQRDIPCRVLGREIGAALIAIIEKCRAADLAELTEKLGQWRLREIQRCEAENNSPERIEDQFSCLLFFMESLDSSFQTIPSLIAKIELLFEDPKPGVPSNKITLSTVHKAKGLEFPTVFILDFFKYMPSRFATQPWQVQQEKNLIYVAITRAMNTLIYINSNCWKDSQ